MIVGIVGIALAVAVIVLSVVVRRGLDAISRGLTACSESILGVWTASRQGSVPAALSERLEAVERRVELALQDLHTQLRRLGQRKRQLLAMGEDPDEQSEDPEQLALARELVAQTRGAPSTSSDNGSRRLVKRR